MLIRKVMLCLITILGYGFVVQAQVDTVYDLPAAFVFVRSEAPDKNQIDSSLLKASSFKSISFLLTQNATTFVKPYGPSSLATLSIRGGQPEQSTIFWNGISLQNNTNGVIDLNLFPNIFFDQISLNNVGSTSRGSGSIAGSVNLDNKQILGDSTLTITATYGQYGAYQLSAILGYRTKNIWQQTRLIKSASKNNYTYKSISYPFDNKVDTLKHALADQFALMHQMHLIFKKIRPLNIRFWLQANERQIPASMLEAISNKSQTDAAIRVQTDWSTAILGGELKMNGALFNEKLVYRDFDTFPYFSTTSVLLLHYLKEIKTNHYLGVDAEYRNFSADADTFYQKTRNEYSLAFHHRFNAKRYATNFSLRSAYYSSFSLSPVLYSLAINSVKRKFLNVGLKINSNYRVPTFNNLYWRPGGNAFLIPERSHNQLLELSKSTKKWNLHINFFSSFIGNQIQWLPGNSGIFEAKQIVDQNTWNRGTETLLELKPFKSFVAKSQFQFTRSGTLNKELKPQKSQQVYIPKVQFSQLFEYRWRHFLILSTIQYVGSRYTNPANTEKLESVWLSQIQIQFQLEKFEVFLDVSNLLNLEYQMLPYRPMPPRLLSLGVRYTTRKNIK